MRITPKMTQKWIRTQKWKQLQEQSQPENQNNPKNEDNLKNEDKRNDSKSNDNLKNTSLAAPGALAHRLQRRTARKANEANLDPPNQKSEITSV